MGFKLYNQRNSVADGDFHLSRPRLHGNSDFTQALGSTKPVTPDQLQINSNPIAVHQRGLL